MVIDIRVEGIWEMWGSRSNPIVWKVEDRKGGDMSPKREKRRNNKGMSGGDSIRVRRDMNRRGRSR